MNRLFYRRPWSAHLVISTLREVGNVSSRRCPRSKPKGGIGIFAFMGLQIWNPMWFSVFPIWVPVSPRSERQLCACTDLASIRVVLTDITGLWKFIHFFAGGFRFAVSNKLRRVTLQQQQSCRGSRSLREHASKCANHSFKRSTSLPVSLQSKE